MEKAKARGKIGAAYRCYRYENEDDLDRLMAVCYYDPVSGLFYSRHEPGKVKCRSNGRYRILTAAGVEVQAHRAAFAFAEGRWPERGMQIDHVNEDGEDNRLTNLRELPGWLNMARSRAVHVYALEGLFVLKLKLDSGRLSGDWLFKTREDAVAAYAEVMEVACRRKGLTTEELLTWMGAASAASLGRA